MGLPEHKPLSRRDLIAFDVRASLPIAVGVLRRHLRPRQVASVLFRYGASSVRDPLADISGEGWPAQRETLLRHQFRAALRMDDALSGVRGLAQDERFAILAEIIAESGAAFLAAHAPMPQPEQWQGASADQRETWVRDTIAQFPNADVDRVYIDDASLGFDVCVCRFQQLAHAVGRPYLAPMFCAADSVHFGRADVPVQLRRTSTIANGGERCDFRFDYS